MQAAQNFEHNSSTFADFLAKYLNGYLPLLLRGFDVELSVLLAPYFAEMKDLEQVTSHIVGLMVGRLHVSKNDTASLSRDLQVDVAQVMTALVPMLKDVLGEEYEEIMQESPPLEGQHRYEASVVTISSD